MEGVAHMDNFASAFNENTLIAFELEHPSQVLDEENNGHGFIQGQPELSVELHHEGFLFVTEYSKSLHYNRNKYLVSLFNFERFRLLGSLFEGKLFLETVLFHHNVFLVRPKCHNILSEILQNSLVRYSLQLNMRSYNLVLNVEGIFYLWQTISKYYKYFLEEGATLPLLI